MKKIFIADPALKDHRGHHFILTQNLIHHSSNAGLRAIAFANKQYQYVAEQPIFPCFSNDTYQLHKTPKAPSIEPEPPRANSFLARLYRRLPVVIRAITTPLITQALASLRDPDTLTTQIIQQVPPMESQQDQSAAIELFTRLQDFGYTPEDRILFHTCDAQTYKDIVHLFLQVVPLAHWNALPTIHLCTPYDEQVMPHNQIRPNLFDSIRKLRQLGLLGNRVRLHAENEILADHLTTTLRTEVTTLPLLPSPTLDRDLPHEGIFTISYLGAAREEKGFLKIPSLVERVLNDETLHLRFIIQASPQILGYTPLVNQAIEKLQGIDDPRLELLLESLSTSEYEETLARSTTLLLCYDPLRYRVRGSGIAVEAILAEKSIIATTDTTPAYFAGDGGIAISYEENADRAVKQIYNNQQQYIEAVRLRKAWYMREYGVDKFLANLQRTQHANPEESDHNLQPIADWHPLLSRDF